jgi:hypothetical protein
MNRLCLSLCAAVLTLASLAACAQDEKASTKKTTSDPAVTNPLLFLLRDPGVQADLKMKDDQRKTVRDMLDEIDGPLWAIRDTGADQGGAVLRQLTAKVSGKLSTVLTSPQRKRLDQLVLQGQGPEALVLPAIASKVGLDGEQKEQVAKIAGDARAAITALQQKLDANNQKEVQKEIARLREEGSKELLDLLTTPQRRLWDELLGKPYDLSKVGSGAIKAPDLKEADAWINSEPLTLEKLRGKVVVVHFWTFG